MQTLKPDTIYLILLLVLPGLLSQSVFNSMVSTKHKQEKNIYNAILHSMLIYVLVYPFVVLILGVNIVNIESISKLVTMNRWAPLITVSVMVVASCGWGVLYEKIYTSNKLKNFFRKFGEAAEPPNIFAALLVEEYWQKDAYFWIVAKTKVEGQDGLIDGFIEGSVEKVAVEQDPREIYLTKVSYLDHKRNVVLSLPENAGVVLKVDQYEVVEITTIPKDQE
ncbi:hypothetical protein Dred_0859 [Desulforamulus reducens MI-1]|uniref:Uncharacterized protein n=1 Tax=Desulforamulus reducens (strain ATCC BAA-1160 / DSM 100696 / MI-1) TaxID=349161 RepID=A4J2U4_DESRM|nr:DUF6338 family protein [Desulforamulus reducens]ABO49397.1 hypothetical protein Dred_0859 [Desulforamulus reducens MI-1]